MSFPSKAVGSGCSGGLESALRTSAALELRRGEFYLVQFFPAAHSMNCRCDINKEVPIAGYKLLKSPLVSASIVRQFCSPLGMQASVSPRDPSSRLRKALLTDGYLII